MHNRCQTSASHSSSSAGSGTGGGAGGETESAAGEQPASGEERASGQHGNEDNISAARRALNQTELMLAQSQAVLIMRGLMNRLTTVVTNSLRSDDGSEEATMIAEGAGEHHQMLIAVRDSSRKTCTDNVPTRWTDNLGKNREQDPLVP